MNIRTSIIVLPMLLAIGTGCDRRDAEPIEPSDTATTVIDTSATAPTSTVPSATESCAGLTGDAQTDCRMRTNDVSPPAAEAPVDSAQDTGDAPPG